MKLLAILAVLLMRRFEWRLADIRFRDGFDAVLAAPAPLFGVFGAGPGTRLLLLALAWGLLALFSRTQFHDFLFGLPLLAGYVLVAWCCIGHDRLGMDLDEYLRRWYRDDEAEWRDFARRGFGVDADSVADVHRLVVARSFVRAWRDTFSWVVLLALLGLPGLMAYAAVEALARGNLQGRDEQLARVARDALERIDWFLVRLFGVTLLITGHASRTRAMLENRLLDDEDPPAEFLEETGAAAAGLRRHEEAPDPGVDVSGLRALLQRTLVVWVMIAAATVIVGL